MYRTLAALALGLSLAGSLASASTAHAGIVNQPGRFRIDLPPDFRVVKHGRVANSPSYMLLAHSKLGNVKLYIQSAPHPDPTIDLAKHMNLWASSVRKLGIYGTLHPIGTPHRDHAMMTQVFAATARRVRTNQPYTVYVGITLDRTTKRVYTFSVASQTSFFHKNKARLLGLARAFRPYHGETIARRPGQLLKGKRVSLRGRLIKQPSGLIVSRKR